MTPKVTRAAFIVFFVILVVTFLYMASPLMSPAFVAAIVATVFYPFYHKLDRLFGQRHYAAAIVSTLLCFCIVLIPIALVLTLLSVKMVGFALRLMEQIQAGHLGPFLDEAGRAVNSWIATLPGGENLVINLRETILQGLKAVANFLYQYSPQFISSTASIALGLLFVAIFLVVFFAEGARISALVLRVLPLSAVHQKEMSREIRVMISALLLGMIGTALLQGLLIGVGFWAAGFSNVIMWGIIAILAAFIPIIGAAVCYIGATAVLAAMGRWDAAALFLLYGVVVVSSVDNVLKPLAMRGVVKVHPVLLFVALLGGVRAFGPIGVVFGPVLLALFLASLRIYQREFATAES